MRSPGKTGAEVVVPLIEKLRAASDKETSRELAIRSAKERIRWELERLEDDQTAVPRTKFETILLGVLAELEEVAQ